MLSLLCWVGAFHGSVNKGKTAGIKHIFKSELVGTKMISKYVYIGMCYSI